MRGEFFWTNRNWIHRNSTGILPKFYYTGIQIEFLNSGRNIRLCYSRRLIFTGIQIYRNSVIYRNSPEFTGIHRNSRSNIVLLKRIGKWSTLILMILNARRAFCQIRCYAARARVRPRSNWQFAARRRVSRNRILWTIIIDLYLLFYRVYFDSKELIAKGPFAFTFRNKAFE